MENIIPSFKTNELLEKTFSLPQELSYQGAILPSTLVIFIQRMRRIPGYEQLTFKEEKDGFISFVKEQSLKEEEYQISFKESGIQIVASADHGFSNALVSLYLLALKNKGKLLEGEIKDSPNYDYRGFMLDSCRHFFKMDEVKKIIEQMSLVKLNIFHFHLSEDQGFRIESKKYPKLNEIGSYRDGTYKDKTRYGGYYTQEEIKDLVKFAGERFITVVPEIDMPGHTTAIIASYPELSCSGKETQVATVFGVLSRTICPSKDKTFEFLEGLFDEILPLFPGPYFHLGGDEAPDIEWQTCPDCRKLMKEKGMKDAREIQGYFTEKIIEILKKHHKIPLGWNDVLYGGKMDKDFIAQFWMERGEKTNPAIKEAEGGRKFICSNTFSLYFDYPFAAVPLKATYDYKPNINGKPLLKENVFGIEAPLWAELLTSDKILEERAFPRIAVLAETAWKDNEQTDYHAFKKTLKNFYLPLVSSYQLNYTSLYKADPGKFRKKLGMIPTFFKLIGYGMAYHKQQKQQQEEAQARLKKLEEDENKKVSD